MKDNRGEKRDGSAALVLGAAVLDGGQPSAALKRRALHAARLYRAGGISTVLATGGPPGAAPTEAEVIRSLCLTAGVRDADILVEDQAASTRENIAFARPILAAHGISRVCIVTDKFHARRAMMTARACGLAARVSCPAPTGTPLLRLLRIYLREAAAIALYRLRQWRRR